MYLPHVYLCYLLRSRGHNGQLFQPHHSQTRPIPRQDLPLGWIFVVLLKNKHHKYHAKDEGSIARGDLCDGPIWIRDISIVVHSKNDKDLLIVRCTSLH
jgi:hypothetical protein